jgi:carboxymethylenebutenolidase
MIVTSEYVDIPNAGGVVRTFVAAPAGKGEYPGLWCFSDIFQLTPPMVRACVRLAGYGFVTAAPEIYCRIEPPGTVIPLDDAGRTRGLDDAAKTSVTQFDANCRTGLDWLAKHPRVAAGKIGVMGFCIGGHLAFRAAFQPDVRATVCFYGTGIHNGKLGKEADCESLAQAGAIRGELLMVFGTEDPHVPEEGRKTIHEGLRNAKVRHRTLLYKAQHAFMRDEGPRYDPEATDHAFGEMVGMFRKAFR